MHLVGLISPLYRSVLTAINSSKVQTNGLTLKNYIETSQIGNSGFALPVDDDDNNNNQSTFFFSLYTFPICAVNKSNKVTHSKEKNIIFTMTVFCDEEQTNTFNFPMNEVKENHIFNT